MIKKIFCKTWAGRIYLLVLALLLPISAGWVGDSLLDLIKENLGPFGDARWAGRIGSRCFWVRSAPGGDDPVLTVLRFLTGAEAVALAPEGSDLAAKEQGVRTRVAVPAGTYTCPEPETPCALPAMLVGQDGEIPISSWANGRHIGRDNLKFWAGAGGYSGAAFARDALDLVRPLAGDGLAVTAANPFAFAWPQSSSFRFDWRRDYTAPDVGFSPNDHKAEICMVGYPLVELLAAIGLQHARPLRMKKLAYQYGAWGMELPTLFARAVLGLANPGVPHQTIRTFTMYLVNSGKDDRCIKDALEDTQP